MQRALVSIQAISFLVLLSVSPRLDAQSRIWSYRLFKWTSGIDLMAVCEQSNVVLAARTATEPTGKNKSIPVTLVVRLDSQGHGTKMPLLRDVEAEALACRGNRLFVATRNGSLLAQDLQNNLILWKTKGLATTRSVLMRLAITEKNLALAAISEDGQIPWMAVREADGTLTWAHVVERKKPVERITGLFSLPDGGWMLGLDNSVINMDSAGRIRDTVQLPEGVTSMAPWRRKKLIASGRFGIVALSGRKVLWRIRTPIPVKAIAVRQDRLVGTTAQGLMFSMDLSKRKLRWLKVVTRPEVAATLIRKGYRTARGVKTHGQFLTPVLHEGQITSGPWLDQNGTIYLLSPKEGILAIRDEANSAESMSDLPRLMKAARRLVRALLQSSASFLTLRALMPILFILWLIFWIFFSGRAASHSPTGGKIGPLVQFVQRNLPRWVHSPAAKRWGVFILGGLVGFCVYRFGARGLTLLYAFANPSAKTQAFWMRSLAILGPGLLLWILPPTRLATAWVLAAPFLIAVPLWILGAYSPTRNFVLGMAPEGIPAVTYSMGLAWAMTFLGAITLFFLGQLPLFLWGKAQDDGEVDWCAPKKKQFFTWFPFVVTLLFIIVFSIHLAPAFALFIQPAFLGVALYAALVGVAIWPLATDTILVKCWDDSTDEDSARA